MKVLLVGCGSIGKRHLSNLIKLPEIDQILVYSKINTCLDHLKDKRKVLLVESIDDIQVDLAVIANETCKHAATALILAKKGVHLFIEKPLSHILSGKLKTLEETIIRKKVKVSIGYNMRFLGAIKLIKKIVAEGTLGKIYFVKIEVGQYMPDWRVGRDYRDSYSAFKSLGGGVALDLSHEVDYMRYLFGDPVSCKVVKKKVSDLKIDSEDIFEGIYVYDRFLCNVHMDYLQKDIKRIIRIETSKGSLVCDFIAKKIVIRINDKEKIIADKKLFDMDKTYIHEIKSFIRAVEKGYEPEISFEDGVRVMELIYNKNV